MISAIQDDLAVAENCDDNLPRIIYNNMEQKPMLDGIKQKSINSNINSHKTSTNY